MAFQPGDTRMLMVDTEIKPSTIHGLGLYLREPVRQGQVIWKFDARVDRVYTQAEIDSLPEHMRRHLDTYVTYHAASGLWVLCGDNGRFINHSESPNTTSDAISFGHDFAACDLPAGTELTSDYRTICDRIRARGMGYYSEAA